MKVCRLNRDDHDSRHAFGRVRPRGKKSRLSVTLNRRIENLSSKESPHKTPILFKSRIGSWARDHIQLPKKHNLRQVPFFRSNSTKQWVLRSSLQPTSGSHCKFDNMEKDLLKDLLISNMRSSNVQIVLLCEMRSIQMVLIYAVNKKRGREFQQQILKASSNWNSVPYVRQKTCTSIPSNSSQKTVSCRKCGNSFSMARL